MTTPATQRLVQEHERDRDREERRRADDDRRPRGPGFSHGKREEGLRETGAEQTGEQERPQLADVDRPRRRVNGSVTAGATTTVNRRPASALAPPASANRMATVIAPNRNADAITREARRPSLSVRRADDPTRARAAAGSETTMPAISTAHPSHPAQPSTSSARRTPKSAANGASSVKRSAARAAVVRACTQVAMR